MTSANLLRIHIRLLPAPQAGNQVLYKAYLFGIKA